jgi:hypothetical protein
MGNEPKPIVKAGVAGTRVAVDVAVGVSEPVVVAVRAGEAVGVGDVVAVIVGEAPGETVSVPVGVRLPTRLEALVGDGGQVGVGLGVLGTGVGRRELEKTSGKKS